MVHLLELGNVHCRGPDDEHARLGGLSACSLLCRLWNHGSLLKPRHGKNGCDDQDRRGLILWEIQNEIPLAFPGEGH